MNISWGNSYYKSIHKKKIAQNMIHYEFNFSLIILDKISTKAAALVTSMVVTNPIKNKQSSREHRQFQYTFTKLHFRLIHNLILITSACTLFSKEVQLAYFNYQPIKLLVYDSNYRFGFGIFKLF